MGDLEARWDAEVEMAYGLVESGPVTIERYVKTWIAERQKIGLADTANTESRLRDLEEVKKKVRRGT
jgi:hypothetical protein